MAGIRANLAGIHTLHDYVAQHWQGGFTLGYAVWVNAVLLGLLLDLPMDALRWGTDELSLAGYGPAAVGLLLLALAADLAITAWLLVGVARSAALHEERGGRPLWALLTRCVLVVILIGLPFLLVDEFRTLRDLVLTSGRLLGSIG
jgi:hypothetical protein